MVIELLNIFAIFLGGCALIRLTGIRGWPLPALGFIAGLSLQVITGSLQAITGLPTSPILTQALTFGLPFSWWLVCLVRKRDVLVRWQPALLTIALLVFLVGLLRSMNMVNWHTDTFRYLMVGSLLAEGSFGFVTINLLTKRLLAAPVIHAPANLQGEYYLHSVFPLLALATVLLFTWFLYWGLQEKLDKKSVIYFTLVGVLLLITNNRFVFHAFYINAHLFFAALVMILAGCNWLLCSRTGIPVQTLLTMQLLAIPALVVARPEASMVAGLVLLPFLLTDGIPRWHRALLLVVLGLSMITWQSLVAGAYIGRGLEVPFFVSGLLVSGIAVVLAIPVVFWKHLGRYAGHILLFVEGGLWLALIYFAVTQPEIFSPSVRAVLENVMFDAGSWGFSLVILVFLIAFILILTDLPDRIFLRFPVTTFVPFAMLLAHMRGGPYRVGDGDSLNRSLIHMVPLAILLVVTAAGSGRWELPSVEKIKRRLRRWFREADDPDTLLQRRTDTAPDR